MLAGLQPMQPMLNALENFKNMFLHVNAALPLRTLSPCPPGASSANGGGLNGKAPCLESRSNMIFMFVHVVADGGAVSSSPL